MTGASLTLAPEAGALVWRTELLIEDEQSRFRTQASTVEKKRISGFDLAPLSLQGLLPAPLRPLYLGGTSFL